MQKDTVKIETPVKGTKQGQVKPPTAITKPEVALPKPSVKK